MTTMKCLTRFAVSLLAGILWIWAIRQFWAHRPSTNGKTLSCNPALLDNVTFVTAPPGNGSKLKTILLWTDYFGSKTWDYDRLGTFPFEHELCRRRCWMTSDRSQASTADAVLLHYFDVNPSNWPVRLPERVTKVLVVHEPPPITGNRMYAFDGNVHVIMSYRRDSDLYSPYRVMKRVERAPEAETRRYRPRVRLAGRNGSVVWAVSRCSSSSEREKYVRELSKYIGVDIYGACGTMSCPKSQWHECMERFATGYKFYLSAENSICRDYVSEKFFEPFRHDIIPVVLGEDDTVLSRHITPDAYVNAKNFESPRHLAEYLKKVASDEALFNKYFQWKTDYWLMRTHGPLTPGLCRLCDWLNVRDQRVTCPHRADVSKWWYEGTCDNGFVSRQLNNA